MTNQPQPLPGAVTPVSELADRAIELMAQGGAMRIMDFPGDRTYASHTFSGGVSQEIASRALSAPPPPADVAGLVERAEAAEAALADARDKALEEAAKVAQGQYREVSMLDHESPSYGIDMTPDRSDWGRGIKRGREQAAAAIRQLKKGQTDD